MKKLFKIFVVFVLVSGAVNKGFAQENKNVPNWATAYADDALVKRINDINNELLSLYQL